MDKAWALNQLMYKQNVQGGSDQAEIQFQAVAKHSEFHWSCLAHVSLRSNALIPGA